jgi:hypothetical protein
MTLFRSFALALLLFSTISSPLQAHQADGRSLGMIVTFPEHGDYESALQVAIDAGVTRVPLTFFWSALEPEKEVYDDRNLAIAALYFPAMGIPIDIAITPITSNQVVMPADLAGKPFDDPDVVARYLRLLDHVMTVLSGAQIGTLLVGVEVDTLLGHDPTAWASFASFTSYAADFVHREHPGVEVGVQSTTYSRTTDPDDWTAVDEVCDFIATSYYPLDGLMVRDPSEVADDFDALTAQYPEKPIRIVEAGFPSSHTNGSSPELQAQFVHELFAAWDDHADQILSIALATEHEYAPFWVDQFQHFYDNKSPRFASFIGSIGLRSWQGDGKPKPAWEALLQETESRGWRP